MMDWLSALAAQDQSLEGLLAKRDLSKQQQLLLAAAREAEVARSNAADEGLKGRQIDETSALRRATQEENSNYRAQLQTDRTTTEHRNRYNTVADNLSRSVQRGVAPHVDKGTAELIREFEGPQSVTDANVPEVGPVDPNAIPDYIYRRQEAEQAALLAKHLQERQDAQDVRAEEELNLRREGEKRQADEAKDRQKSREVQRKAVDARTKAAEAIAQKLSPAGSKEASQAAKARLDAMEKSGSWFGKSAEEVQMDRANVVHEEFDKVRRREEAAKGKAPGPSDLTAETPEQRGARLLQQLQGGG